MNAFPLPSVPPSVGSQIDGWTLGRLALKGMSPPSVAATTMRLADCQPSCQASTGGLRILTRHEDRSRYATHFSPCTGFPETYPPGGA